ncbi:tRNA (adenosine(37)-N6)-threonylcarbamoyltransferase complex dimerization subunit type 1 TsaB [Marinicrinis sediminis]|uniref:tRNA (Adenosine(37)-N6)-threonylcarbamoyltransferase complex dimerization subunit type 1 TsaB n=1 Tax=Marinicrinis sediminis TaxID=1652465 RepID=A0ABW5R9P3_9BACL
MIESKQSVQEASRWLALDTSTATLSVSLLTGEEEEASIQLEANRNHSIQLLPTVEKLMQERQWPMSSLDGIAVGKGPGSYTGIRVGVTAAKTLAWALQIPVIGVSSLHALALPHVAEQTEVWVVPVMNGRRGQVYTSLYTHRKQPGLAEDGIRLLDHWLSELKQRVEAHGADRISLQFIGEIAPFEQELNGFQQDMSGIASVTVQESLMRAKAVGWLGMDQARQDGSSASAVHTLVPNYTQLAEAEKKLKAKQKSR